MARIAIYHDLPSGGAKRLLYETTKRLAANHSIDVYTLSCANHEFCDVRPYVDNYIIINFNPIRQLSSIWRRLNQANRITDLLRLRLISKKIAQKIIQGSYDTILVHPCQFEQSPSILYYLQNCHTIYYCHEQLRGLYETIPIRPYYGTNSIKRQILNKIDPIPTLYRLILHQINDRNTCSAERVLVNSKFTSLAINRIYQVDACVCYPGVDTDRFHQIMGDKSNMVLSVGSLTPLKGFDFLIKAIANIQAEKRPVLVIASNFQNQLEKEYLEQLANSLGINLKMVSNISDDNLVKLYNEASVTIYSPIREPFGLVPLESMACNTPVVAVKEGGIAETIIHMQTGLLVDRDPVLFAESLQNLLSDPIRAKEYGHNGRNHVLLNWTWENSIRTLEHYLIV